LLPEAHFAGIAKEPAVADDAVFLRELSGQDARLGRAGDGRHYFLERANPARLGKALKPWCETEQAPGETDRIDQDERLYFSP
jgi:hypothetical protein